MAKVAAVETQAPKMLTIKQLAELHGLKKEQVTTAVATHAAFKAEGVIDKRIIEGTDLEVKYINADVFATWLTNKATATTRGGVTRTRAEGTRYTLLVKPEKLEALTAFLNAEGISFERAYKGKPKSKGTPAEAETTTMDLSVAPTDQATVSDLFQSEAVVA